MADLDLKIRKARKKTLGTRIIKSHTLTLKSMSQLQGNKTKLRERERERERGRVQDEIKKQGICLYQNCFRSL